VAILRHPLGDADRLTHLMSFGDQADPQKRRMAASSSMTSM
jgi:hypothetical protein